MHANAIDRYIYSLYDRCCSVSDLLVYLLTLWVCGWFLEFRKSLLRTGAAAEIARFNALSNFRHVFSDPIRLRLLIAATLSNDDNNDNDSLTVRRWSIFISDLCGSIMVICEFTAKTLNNLANSYAVFPINGS